MNKAVHIQGSPIHLREPGNEAKDFTLPFQLLSHYNQE